MQWIFDQAEERRVNLEQKAQSTFGLMVFLVPLLASLFVFIISRGTTSSTLIVTLVLVSVSAVFLLLGFISAVRAVAVKESETLFLDSVLTEDGQFRKYSEAFRARGLLYCASMNTATNDHIAQFVKGAHILTAVAVLVLLVAAVPTSLVFLRLPSSPAETKIVGLSEHLFPRVVRTSRRYRDSQERYSEALKQQRVGGWVQATGGEDREARHEVERIAKCDAGWSPQEREASSAARVSESLSQYCLMVSRTTVRLVAFPAEE